MDFPIVELTAPVFEELVALTGFFTDENFNAKPASGGWSAGQTVQHIKLSVGNIAGLLNSITAETDRDPQQYIDRLRAIFMDFGNKMQSPEFIAPKDKAYSRQKMMDYFLELKEEVQQIIEEEDLSLTCQDYTLPGFPAFTRVEWLAFATFHTQRHIHQLRTISTQI